jgi:hypothetical protein
MQPPLLARPSDRNIKAADVADFAKVAMIVEVGDFQKLSKVRPPGVVGQFDYGSRTDWKRPDHGRIFRA